MCYVTLYPLRVCSLSHKDNVALTGENCRITGPSGRCDRKINDIRSAEATDPAPTVLTLTFRLLIVMARRLPRS